MIYYRLNMLEIYVWENWRENQEWTIQRHWQDWVRINTTQKTKKMSNMDPTQKRMWTQVLAKGRQFLLLIYNIKCSKSHGSAKRTEKIYLERKWSIVIWKWLQNYIYFLLNLVTDMLVWSEKKNVIVICLESSGSHDSVLHFTNPQYKTII